MTWHEKSHRNTYSFHHMTCCSNSYNNLGVTKPHPDTSPHLIEDVCICNSMDWNLSSSHWVSTVITIWEYEIWSQLRLKVLLDHLHNSKTKGNGLKRVHWDFRTKADSTDTTTDSVVGMRRGTHSSYEGYKHRNHSLIHFVKPAYAWRQILFPRVTHTKKKIYASTSQVDFVWNILGN